jgi:hypothetical protein
MIPTPAPNAVARPRAALAALAALPVLALAAGCSAGPENSVSGKVTVAGSRPVTDGFVTFYGVGNKKATAHITPDGRYFMADPPKGQVRVAVTAAPVAAPPPGTPPLVGVHTAEPPPAQYGDPNNGLTVTVNGGRQTADLDLKP